MNEVCQTIVNRRSIRRYLPQPVADDILQQILDAGRFAPSGRNEQAWYFIAIQNQAIIQEMRAACTQLLGSTADPLYGAPAVILIFAKNGAIDPIQDTSAAMENILLAAASLGIGSCWIDAPKNLLESPEGPAWMQKLKVPEGFTIQTSCLMGYSDGPAPVALPRKENTFAIIQ